MTDRLLEIILDELEAAQILRFQDGIYELKHDSLTSTIIKKRTAEQEELNDLYATIKQNLKIGTLSLLQLERIKPLRQKLHSKYENDEIKKEAEEFIDAQIEAHEKDARSKEKQKIDLIKAKNKAVWAARFAAALALCILAITILVWLQYNRTRNRLIHAYSTSADSAISHGDFLTAYQKMKMIDNNSSIFVILDKPTASELDTLDNTLLLHLTASAIEPNIIANDSFVAFKANNKIVASGLAKICDTCKLLAFDQKAIDGGISEDISQYWTANATPAHKYEIWRGDINRKETNSYKTGGIHGKEAAKQTLGPAKFVDTVDIPTADYNSKGDLYYLKYNSILCNDRRTGEKSKIWVIDDAGKMIEPSFKKDAADMINKIPHTHRNITARLEFLLTKNRRPSDLLKITIKKIQPPSNEIELDTSFIVNTNMPQRHIKVFGGSAYYLHQNQILYYSIPVKDSIHNIAIYNIYRWDFSKNNSKTNPQLFSTKIAPMKSPSESIEKILTEKKLISNSSDVTSPDSQHTLYIGGISEHKILIKRKKQADLTEVLPQKDTIIGFSAQKSFFTYIYTDSKKEQFAVFETYERRDKQEFKIPKNWHFSYFKNNVIVFAYGEKHGRDTSHIFRPFELNNDSKRHNLFGVFVMDISMTKRGHWYDWYHLLEGREKKRHF